MIDVSVFCKAFFIYFLILVILNCMSWLVLWFKIFLFEKYEGYECGFIIFKYYQFSNSIYISFLVHFLIFLIFEVEIFWLIPLFYTFWFIKFTFIYFMVVFSFFCVIIGTFLYEFKQKRLKSFIF